MRATARRLRERRCLHLSLQVFRVLRLAVTRTPQMTQLTEVCTKSAEATSARMASNSSGGQMFISKSSSDEIWKLSYIAALARNVRS